MYKVIGGDQKEYGPATADELREWIRDGRLSRYSRVLPDGAAQWTTLGALPEFADSLQAQATQTRPPAAPTPELDAAAYSAHILSRPAELRISRCFAEAWDVLSANFGVLFGATFIIWLISLVEFLPLLGVAYWVVRGALFGGLYLVYLKCLRGEPASVGDAFRGFGPIFVQCMLAGLVSSLLSNLGALLCLLPWIYLTVAWIFCVPLAADKRLEFWSAMELSRKMVNRVWLDVFGLLLLAFLPVILTTLFVQIKLTAMLFPVLQGFISSGAPDFTRLFKSLEEVAKVSVPLTLLIKIVLLFNLPFALGAVMSAYETLFGTRTAPRA